MPIKLMRLMDAYGKRATDEHAKGMATIHSRRLEEVRDAALRLAAELQKILKQREAEETKAGKG
jgi:hypothetical protein